MLRDLMTDRVAIRTADGVTYPDVRASVQRNRIFTDKTDIPIRPGDQVIRQTTAGVEEVFVVDDPGFHGGIGGIPDTYQMHVHRADAVSSAHSTVAYNVTGPNTRLNINSIDVSTNVMNQAPAELFQALREAIQATGAGAADQDQLLARVTDLEQAYGKKSFARSYAEFMALAANHMEVLGPFIPALTQLLRVG